MEEKSRFPYRVLVVDDEEYARVKALDELAELAPAVEVNCASSLDEGEQLIRSQFFNLAFVDLHLVDIQSSLAMLELLHSVAPSCSIIVMAQELPVYANHVLMKLTPDSRIDGAVDKVVGPTDWFRPNVLLYMKKWRSSLIDIDDLSPVVDQVKIKAERLNADLRSEGVRLASVREDPTALEHEIAHLLLLLFGDTGAALANARSGLKLRPFRKGFSSSVVVEATPEIRLEASGKRIQGNRCVVKIGSRPGIRREAERYGQVVRFGVKMEHRVEFLGLAEGDTLAAICYSLAGGNSTRLKSYDDLLGQHSDAWRPVLRNIFSEESSNWYSVEAPVKSLREYFRVDQGAPLDNCHSDLMSWVRELGAIAGVKLAGSELHIGEHVLRLPDRKMLASQGLVRSIAGCLVHGDLHGGNIILGEEEHAFFIDYANAGLGARFVDFSALQASARFVDAESVVESFARSVYSEFDLDIAYRFLDTIDLERSLAAGTVKEPAVWWQDHSLELHERSQFYFPHAESDEALWTDFAYCLSLFRFPLMGWHTKLRLLIWLSGMVEVLAGDLENGHREEISR